jgi:Rod binding domain-containing protein|tara:strand:- start:154 stop:504 length:351 start_codon:yes stop_codon:yes gene_type:complete
LIQASTAAAIGLGQADNVDLAQVASNSQLSDDEKLKVAARQFEAMLARQILKDAYKPILANGLEMNGVSAEIYRDMIVRQLGDAVGKTGAFGISTSLQGQLAAERLAKPEDKGGQE